MGSSRHRCCGWGFWIPCFAGVHLFHCTVSAENETASVAVTDLLHAAGNALTDEVRLERINELIAHPECPEGLRSDAERLREEIDRWLNSPDLDFFSKEVRKTGTYDFNIAEDSALFPLAQFYLARMLVWVTLEYGDIWGNPTRRREMLDNARFLFELIVAKYPENQVARMYLGDPVPPCVYYRAVPGAPEWAVYQREALERLTDIIEWWVQHRMRPDGSYRGGWGDDCEMWRWWTPVLIGFDVPMITAAQARFSRAMFAQEHMAEGYTRHLYDVEHTAEDSADTLTPMMHLEPDNPEWAQRALRLADLTEHFWTGKNARGMRQFKSTYFSVNRIDDSPRRACDTPMHVRAVQPVLLYWQRTGDPRLTTLFREWMDTWVDAAARAESGKPAGVIPAAIHWPEGTIGGLGETWWDPENHSADPLYVWPSAVNQMLYALLQTYFMTGDATYLEPLKASARLRVDYLHRNPKEPVREGSALWCGERLGGIKPVLAKYRQLTGDTSFDALLTAEAPPYAGFRLTGERRELEWALRDTAEALRINFDGYTREVRYTDRVLRFPALFASNGMFPDAIVTIRQPDTSLLYSSVTGDWGDALYLPLNAVRWMTPSRDIAALVTFASEDKFESELFHFGEEVREFDAKLFLLKPGHYVKTLRDSSAEIDLEKEELSVSATPFVIRVGLPARRLCRLSLHRVSEGN